MAKRQQHQPSNGIELSAAAFDDSGCSESTDLAPELEDAAHPHFSAGAARNRQQQFLHSHSKPASGVNNLDENFDDDEEANDDDEEDDDDDLTSSLADRVVWHQDDLIVAAELGKALLERNRRLTLRLRRARAAAAERSREAAQLAAGLAAARRLDEGRSRACEEVERHCAELERGNEQLRQERRRLMSRLEALAAAEAAAEARADDLRRRLAQANQATVAASAAAASSSELATMRRRGSWPGLAVPAATASVGSMAQERQRRSRGEAASRHPERIGAATSAASACSRRRETAPSAPPPTSRQRQQPISHTDEIDAHADAEGRLQRRRLASGQHEPAYRSIFAEARARLRQLLDERPDEEE